MIAVAFAAMALMTIPYLIRGIAGPTVFDRLTALNAIGSKVATMIILVGLLYERPNMFVDIALALFLLNFVTTLLLARYVREHR